MLLPDHQALFVTCNLPVLSAKLADIGMLPGTLWKLLSKTPFSGPVIIGNGQTRLSIRREDADSILMEEK
jgi:Fe2+ transport system protein FeoA